MGAFEDRYINRSGWGARQPKSVTYFPGVRTSITLHYEGVNIAKPANLEAGKQGVRNIQNFHMSKEYVDIAYNFLVDQNGYIYEGRGLQVRSGANGTNAGNNSSYAVCVMSGPDTVLDPVVFESLKLIIEFLDPQVSGSAVYPHKKWKATACPGSVIDNWIKAGMPTGSTPLPPVTPAPGPKPTPAPRILKKGDTGQDVKDIQIALNIHGYKLVVDGDFGAKTDAAVKDFQKKNKLTVDGIVGPKTREALNKSVSVPTPAPAPKPVPTVVNYPQYAGTPLKKGSKGTQVRLAQQRLKERGWSISVDGDFGAGTEKVVKAFQKEKGLTQDGVIGSNTWKALWETKVTK